MIAAGDMYLFKTHSKGKFFQPIENGIQKY
jgi:hypothetical protein